jgi:hypothetical protein
LVPLSANTVRTSASHSKRGGAEGSASQRRRLRRPFGVIAYTVRGRRPVASARAVASPWRMRFFGSS